MAQEYSFGHGIIFPPPFWPPDCSSDFYESLQSSYSTEVTPGAQREGSPTFPTGTVQSRREKVKIAPDKPSVHQNGGVIALASPAGPDASFLLRFQSSFDGCFGLYFGATAINFPGRYRIILASKLLVI